MLSELSDVSPFAFEYLSDASLFAAVLECQTFIILLLLVNLNGVHPQR